MEVSGQIHAPATVPPRKELPVPIGHDAWRAPEPALGSAEKKKKPCLCRESNPSTEKYVNGEPRSPIGLNTSHWGVLRDWKFCLFLSDLLDGLVGQGHTFHRPCRFTAELYLRQDSRSPRSAINYITDPQS
jgi:hypothetical protein